MYIFKNDRLQVRHYLNTVLYVFCSRYRAQHPAEGAVSLDQFAPARPTLDRRTLLTYIFVFDVFVSRS